MDLGSSIVGKNTKGRIDSPVYVSGFDEELLSSDGSAKTNYFLRRHEIVIVDKHGNKLIRKQSKNRGPNSLLHHRNGSPIQDSKISLK